MKISALACGPSNLSSVCASVRSTIRPAVAVYRSSAPSIGDRVRRGDQVVGRLLGRLSRRLAGRTRFGRLVSCIIGASPGVRLSRAPALGWAQTGYVSGYRRPDSRRRAPPRPARRTAPGRRPPPDATARRARRDASQLERLDRAVVGPRGRRPALRRGGRRPGDGGSARRPRRSPTIAARRARSGRRRSPCARPCAPGVGECPSWPTTSGRCWISVPPSATFISCMPRQMPSTGSPRVQRGAEQRELGRVPSGPHDRGHAARAAAPYRPGSMSGPPEMTRPSRLADRRLDARHGRQQHGTPPAAATCST